jgi:hypothetical protein
MGEKRAFQLSQVPASEQTIDHIRDARRPPLDACQGQPARSHPTATDRCDIVTARLSVVIAVDVAARARFIPVSVVA